MNVLIVADFDAQLSLAESELHIEGPFSVTDNCDHFIRVFSDHRLFLANTNFCSWLNVTLPLRRVESRLITLPLVTSGVDRPKIFDYSGPNPWIRFTF